MIAVHTLCFFYIISLNFENLHLLICFLINLNMLGSWSNRAGQDESDCQHSQVSVSSSAVSGIRQATCDQEENIKIKKRTLAKRRAETFEVSLKIHGGKTKESKPAAAGLVDVLETKFSRKTLSSLITRNESYVPRFFQIFTTRS